MIPAALADEIVAHARREFPNECCGMVAGEGETAVRVFAAANTEASPFMYVMDPREQFRIMEEIDEAGWDTLAIYHSHTRSAAYPSRTDVELAFFPDTLYLIVSLAERERPQMRAFRITRDPQAAQEIVEAPVEIV